MIIQNGTIEIKTKVAGGIDPATGYPTKPTCVSWKDPIPCQYIVNNHNNLGISNGEHFTIATYIVLIEEQPFDAEQVRLVDMSGNEIGEFSIIKIVPLEAVGEIEIFI